MTLYAKQGWYSVKKWVGWRYKCHVRAGEIWNQAETNPIQRFPKFDGLSQPPSSFEDVFRHFVMNLSDFFWLHSHFSVHGRAHHSFPTSLVPNKSLYLGSTFSASPHRGLRHSSQNQKQIQITIWWWDEVPCLTTLVSPEYNIMILTMPRICKFFCPQLLHKDHPSHWNSFLILKSPPESILEFFAYSAIQPWRWSY